ncbi:MAG: hypothetical protein NC300_03165 [Bacteroidales bacterium]|nr:hypothetical protein [Clostridium sp.]MCM1203118.1 hypothetical protein [Bacteroidales bacterium]
MRNERKKKTCGKAIFVLALFMLLTVYPAADAKAAWVKDWKGYRYTTNAAGTKYYKNKWAKIDNKYYYFDKRGYRKTGWLTYKGKRYYLDKSGVRVTGFKKIKKKKYFFSKTGVMITGWLKYQNTYYYLNKKGVVQTGMKSIGDYVYYFDGTGKRISGANIVLGNMTYYFAENGVLQYTGTEEEKAAKYINARRMIKGQKPLQFDFRNNLSKAAFLRAKEIAGNNSHIRPDGTDYNTVIEKDYPVSAYWSGECISWGGRMEGVTVAANWLSDNNASVLLQKEADRFSIGSYTDDSGRQYWAALVIQKK